ncbi:glycosyltransferase family 8 protein [Pseudalkalibacillus caeni]|uniref:glycosyltransferase family 8 protein n=1 Tax=Exobacillus caeni TaxID=2574798 RepID=UPI0014855762|nr:glycosyltransferase family 8 protein [Pseudalkalibacillus caeni]
MDPIQLVTATDDKYAKPLGVMLKSLLENKKSDLKINIYIITSNLSTHNEFNIRGILKDYDIDPTFIKIDKGKYSNYKERDYISKETYYRLSIPELLDTNIVKVLYLDCDIIVKEDITLLWKEDLEGFFVAGVKELPRISRYKKKKLSIPKRFGYFNSGVLLINLKKWREQNITNQIIDYMKNNSDKISFPSQDPMNAILYDKWKKLNPKWNYRHNLRLSIEPAIIHYTGKNKPWNASHPFKDEYEKYNRMVTWKTT